MRVILRLTLILVLSLAAAYQIHARSRNDPLDVLLPGEVLNTRALDDHTEREILRERSPGCFVAWIMDPDCPGCNRLAELQGRRMRGTRMFYWLFAGSSSAVASFVARYGLDREQVLRLASPGNVREALHGLGISATPTRLVVRDSDLIVQEVRVVDATLVEAPDVVDPALCGAAAN